MDLRRWDHLWRTAVSPQREVGIGDVETADEGTIHHHSYGDNSSDKHYYSSKKAKTLSLLSPVVYP